MIDPDLDRIAVLGKGKFHNAARALHRFVHREGKTLPIPISTTPLTIRKKGGGCMDVNYPILRLSDWMKFILGEAGGQFLLAGHHTWDTAGFSKVFERFWQNFRSADPSHDIYTRKSVNQRCYTIPLCLHGDEGRGLAKVPVMITNFQCVVPWMGEDHVNTHGPRRSEYLFTVCWCMPVSYGASRANSISFASIKGTASPRGFCTRSCQHPVMHRTT